MSALDAIERLRPQYLSKARARGMTGELVVYVDGVRIGGVEALRAIESTDIREVRRLDAPEATFRFGTGHQAGAIVIATKSGR